MKMRCLVVSIFFSFVFAAIVPSSGNQRTPQYNASKKALIAQHSNYWKWTGDGNRQKILTIVTSDFTFKDSGGMILTRPMLERLSHMPDPPPNGSRKQTFKTEGVELKGADGKIVTTVHFESK